MGRLDWAVLIGDEMKWLRNNKVIRKDHCSYLGSTGNVEKIVM